MIFILEVLLWLGSQDLCLATFREIQLQSSGKVEVKITHINIGMDNILQISVRNSEENVNEQIWLSCCGCVRGYKHHIQRMHTHHGQRMSSKGFSLLNWIKTICWNWIFKKWENFFVILFFFLNQRKIRTLAN